MSKTTAALEAAVAVVIANTPAGEVRQTARQRATADKAFATVLKLIAPRIRHFVRQYGLVAHWDDAEQCCAIGVHRAIQAYDPDKAQFTTFVNWQIRGELQSLRFRLMTDQRPSAKKVEATTVSLHAVTSGPDGEEASLEAMVEDEEALSRTEAGASEYLADAARGALIDQYMAHLRATGVEQLKRRARTGRAVADPARPGLPVFRPRTPVLDPSDLAALEETIAQHRLVVERRLFDDATLDELGADTGIAKERVRQITKRAARTMAELSETAPRFAIMAAGRPAAAPARVRKPRVVADAASLPAPLAILPDADAPHNRLSRVVDVAPVDQDDAWVAPLAVAGRTPVAVH